MYSEAACTEVNLGALSYGAGFSGSLVNEDPGIGRFPLCWILVYSSCTVARVLKPFN